MNEDMLELMARLKGYEPDNYYSAAEQMRRQNRVNIASQRNEYI